MQLKCKEFNVYFIQVKRDWHSGANNGGVYDKVDKLYYDAHRANFRYKDAWLELIQISKFYEIPAKRQKGTNGSSNSSKSDNPEESFDFYDRRRPIGKKQEKAQARYKGKESATSEGTIDLDAVPEGAKPQTLKLPKKLLRW